MGSFDIRVTPDSCGIRDSCSRDHKDAATRRAPEPASASAPSSESALRRSTRFFSDADRASCRPPALREVCQHLVAERSRAARGGSLTCVWVDCRCWWRVERRQRAAHVGAQPVRAQNHLDPRPFSRPLPIRSTGLRSRLMRRRGREEEKKLSNEFQRAWSSSREARRSKAPRASRDRLTAR